MKAKYSMDDHLFIQKLNQQYGIQIRNLEFIPMGDSAYSYIVNCKNHERYYLKLFDLDNDNQRKGVERLSSYLPLTSHLYNHLHIKNMTYPIPQQDGGFITPFSNAVLVLFNFIEGETLADAYPFSDEILREVAKGIARIHRTTSLLNTVPLKEENFDISFEIDLLKCISELEKRSVSESHIVNVLKEELLIKKEQIISLAHLVRQLRDIAVIENKAKVLCHGDVWGGNLILHEKELNFIDWETALLAPPEYDLFHYIGDKFHVFLSSYEEHVGQSVNVNTDLFRFYAYRHHLRNLTNWLMNILYRNTKDSQNENDLDMILHHCMNRWDDVESDVGLMKANAKNIY